MKITKASLSALVDSQFIGFLNKAYATDQPVDRGAIFEELIRVVSRNEYSPKLPELLIDYDKGLGVCRPVPIFKPIDYFVFYYCIKRLETILAVNRVEGTFGGWRLGGSIKRTENGEAIEGGDSPGSGLNPAAFAQKYGEYNSRIKSFLESAPEDVKVLEIDIANFYDCIRVDKLQRQVRSASRKAQLPIVDLLFYFLANCNKMLFSYGPQATGIPQDVVSDCSRLLANFYLQDYDKKIQKYCKKYHIKYLRFADDQLFFMPSGFNPDVVCKESSRLLYSLGLNINQKKVKVRSKADIMSYRGLDIFDLLDVSKTNKEQTKANCDAFAKSSIRAIKKHRSKRNSIEIQNGGTPLLKKCIGLGLERFSVRTRASLMALITDDQTMVHMKSYNLARIYKSLGPEEKLPFLNRVDEVCSRQIHAAFIYEVMLFKKESRLEWKDNGVKITKMTEEWISS